MFKPSLRKSILNDNLCIESQKKHTLFQSTNQVKQRPVYKKQSVGGQSRQIVDVPSMMISQRLLTQTTFQMDHHPDTKVFTPFIYDFKAYPRAVREFIAPNPNAAQAGKCGQINFVIYQKSLFLWIDNSSNKIQMSSPSYTSPSHTSPSHSHPHSPSSSQKQSQPCILLKMHKFSQPIDIAQFSIIKNTKIFTIPKAIILAIVFKNRMKLFMVNEKQLFLEDMMLKYQLKGANRIQHVNFTKNNEIIFAGDNGKLSMISLNGKSSQIITVQQSSILARYLSRSAFDYSTVYNIREITSTDNFIYCLYDRIKKENYLLYVIKKAVNKVVRLDKQPKHIVDETFVDVYRYINDNECQKTNRKSIKLIDRVSQQLVQQKIKQGYSQFTGENVKDGFRIVAVRGRSIIKNNRNNLIHNNSVGGNKQHNNHNNNDHTKQQMKGQSSQQQKNNNSISRVNDSKQGGYRNSLSNGVMQIVTKCGYVIGVVHVTGDQQQFKRQRHGQKHQIDSHNTLHQQSPSQQQYPKTHISFTHQPIKLPSTIGPCNLLQPKLFPSSSIQKSYRKNFVIKAIKSKQNNEEMVLLLSDSLMRISKDGEVNVVRFGDLKVNVMESTIQKEMFISAEQYDKKYNKKSRAKLHNQQQQQKHTQTNQNRTLFPHIQKPSTQKSTSINQHQKHYRLFNHQRRFTSFDNQGRIDIYSLELRHTIIAYISYYLQAKARAEHDQNSHSTLSSILNGSVIDYDSRIQKIFSKVINLYGYCRTIKSLLQILTLNLDYNRQYIHFQRSLLIDTLRKQFESQQQSKQPSSKSRFQEWNYLLNHHQESLLIVVNDQIIDYVWRMIYQLHLRGPLSVEVVSNSNKISGNVIGQSSSLLWQSQLVNNNDYLHPNQTYTAYANALLSLFNQQLSILSTIRTREFKQQSHTIRSCQSNLIKLYELIQRKNKRLMSYRYMNMKGCQLQKQQQLFSKQSKQSFCFNNNTKVNKNDQTTATTTYLLAAGEQQQNDLTNININKTFTTAINQHYHQTNYSTQSNSIVQQQLLTSISKIVTLVDVMSLLIEKDQRQVNQVPSLVSVLTQYKSQLKCGELLFNEQLVFLKQGDSYYDNSNHNNTNIINKVTFLHPQLIQRVLKLLPQLQIDKKIQYLKFKLSRNLIIMPSHTLSTNMNGYQNNTNNNKMLLIDLKSLDLQRLSKLITSNNLPQLNRIFLLSNSSNHQQQSKEFTLQRAENYIEFLTICLTNLLAKTNHLVDIKQSKFNTLSQQVKTTTNKSLQQQQKSNKPLLSNSYSVDKIIMAQQRLSHYQSQMIVFYQQVIKVFKSSVQYLAKVTGHEYYSAQKYLQRIIEMLVCAFPNEEVLIQTIMIILKDANMVDKVQYVRMIKSRMDQSQKYKRIFVDLSKQKEERLTERSTFEYLLNDRNQKVKDNKHDNTIDTLRYVNNNYSIEQN